MKWNGKDDTGAATMEKELAKLGAAPTAAVAEPPREEAKAAPAKKEEAKKPAAKSAAKDPTAKKQP